VYTINEERVLFVSEYLLQTIEDYLYVAGLPQ